MRGAPRGAAWETGMRDTQRGYTIIEIMIVLAILAIVLAFAIPMYKDYTTRSRFSECLNLQAPSKQKISEYVVSNGSMPPASEVPVSRRTEFCDGGTYVRTGADAAILLIGMDEAAAGIGEPGSIVEARLEGHRCPNNDVEWSCYYSSDGGDTLQGRYLPAPCRGTTVEFSEACF